VSRQTKAVLRSLGLRVRELRRAQNMTQEEMAERVGMLTPNYARIEQGRANVTIDTLVRVATALTASLPDLFVAPVARRVPVGRPPKPR
jgi:transcriptional regulator with XRE-family HTH domain